MRYQLMVLEALPRGAALEALAASLPRCVSSCAVELCRMEPFPGPMVVGVSDDEAEIRAACARFESARCVVCVVDRGAGVRDLVERVTRRSVRPAPPEGPSLPGSRSLRAGAVVLAVVVTVAAVMGRAPTRAPSSAAVVVDSSAEVAADSTASPAPTEPARGPLGQLLARMALPPAEAPPSTTPRGYAAWMQQFRARSGVASSPMPASSAVEAAPPPGASSRRRPRRRSRLSSPLAQRPAASSAWSGA